MEGMDMMNGESIPMGEGMGGMVNQTDMAGDLINDGIMETMDETMGNLTSDGMGDGGMIMDHSGMDHSGTDHTGMGTTEGDGEIKDSMDHSGMGHTTGDGTMNMESDLTSGHLHGAAVLGAGVSNGFCTLVGNEGMVMYMEGFRWTLKGESTCINLYFPGWTLDSKGKVWGAMFGVIFLAIATEGISKLRHTLSRKARRMTNPEKMEVKKLAAIQTALHGVHAFTGYILMLATMTFSLEMLISVIIGLVIGYVIFGGDSYSHVTTNPCCAFLEDEANERDDSSSIPSDRDLPTIAQESCCDKTEGPTERLESEADFTSHTDDNVFTA